MTMPPTTKRQHHRRGTLYISVLGTALMVSIAGMTAMHLARTELRAAVGDCETTRARLAAEAAVSYGLATIEQHIDWRTRFDARQPIEVDGGEFQFMFDAGVQPDGSPVPLHADSASPVTLRGIGRSGNSLSVAEVILQPGASESSNEDSDSPSLDAALLAANDIEFAAFLNRLAELRVDNVVYAGGNIVHVRGRANITNNAEAVGAIDDDIVDESYTATEGAPARFIPAPDVAFSYYLRRGTWIEIDQISNENIREQVISPTLNPFGPETNPEGIYVIDCQGQAITIERSRIIGTLVLLNNSDDSIVNRSINWSSAVENYPALLAENGLTLCYNSNNSLSEGDIDTNLNPPGAPHNGIENTTLTETYPNEINGLVYIGGKMKRIGFGVARINGAVICESAELRINLEINHNSALLDFPPPGFAELIPVQVKVGSWRRGEN